MEMCMYEKDDGSYEMFDDGVSLLLSYAEEKGRNVTVEQKDKNGNSVHYDIDLENMTQMNRLTKSVRNVHRFTMRIFHTMDDDNQYRWIV